MVKTIRGLLTLEELRALLTKYAQSQQSYRRVVTDEADITFDDDRITIRLRKPTVEEKCPNCGGTGIRGEEKCWMCDGKGVRETIANQVYAKITEKEYGLKIEVETSGKQPETWRPDVEKIKNFINKLAGKPCIIIPSKGGARAKPIKTIGEILTENQRTLTHYVER